MSKKAIYISIKPQYTKLIESGEKDHEFRNYIPKQEIDVLYVYESSPTCALKYIIELGDIVSYPNIINPQGDGNEDFNNGLKKSKYAYEIKKIFKLKKPILLSELKEKYNFFPPERYAYDDKYPELTKYIQNLDK